jgi:hypothetical protein
MTQPGQPFFMTNVAMLPKQLPPAFAPRITGPHPAAHCLCTWVWAPRLGGKKEPFAMKYWNRVCPVQHFSERTAG